jgi:hypothetical protein
MTSIGSGKGVREVELRFLEAIDVVRIDVHSGRPGRP